MKPMRLIGYLAAAAALAATLGCGSGKFSGGASNNPDHVLSYPIPNNPTKLDPAAVEDGDTIEVLHQMFEGLVMYDENNELVPNLAESWTVSNDGLTYVFKIKPGVKFHNGREMTAEDVKYSWDRAAHKTVQSPTVEGYMRDMVGFEEVWGGGAEGLSGVTVIDPNTLEVKIKSPKAYWPMYLQYACYFIVAKENAGLEPITSVEDMVGTGPFKMTSYEQDQFVEMTRFDDYHGGKPKLEKIRRLIASDPQTRRQMYESGKVDWVALERQDKGIIDQHPEFKDELEIVDRAAMWYVGFGQNAEPAFANSKLRQAFALAIDKQRIIDEGFDGVNRRAEGILPPALPGFDENFKGYQLDPARAKQLLAEAGHPEGKGLPAIKMYFRSDRQDAKILSTMVQQDLRENLGVKVDLAPTEWKALLEMRSRGELGFFHLRWGADYLDPQNFLSFMLHTNARENTLGYSNKEFDRLCDTADRLPMSKQDQRIQMYRQAERIAVDDAIWIPIYFQRDIELVRPSVSDLSRSAMGPLPHTKTDVVWSR
ncbi:MAG: ABC transporter substrate-binding protein [Armatimonadota bacterium]|nr:ABC transporter substrate-binding protein [Armatimonadota bacterium]